MRQSIFDIFIKRRGAAPGSPSFGALRQLDVLDVDDVDTLKSRLRLFSIISFSLPVNGRMRMQMAAPPRGRHTEQQAERVVNVHFIVISSFFQPLRLQRVQGGGATHRRGADGGESRLPSGCDNDGPNWAIYSSGASGGRLKKSSYFELTLQLSRSTATPQHGTVM